MGQWVHTGFRIVFSLLKKTETVSHKSTVYSTQKKQKTNSYVTYGVEKTNNKKKKLKNKDFYMVNYLYRLEMN
uniref:Uncharacterized protein n=1 Tax=Anguilla anguilla TaxID=7936 RepID=A0A0E9X6Q1_ANGAN